MWSKLAIQWYNILIKRVSSSFSAYCDVEVSSTGSISLIINISISISSVSTSLSVSGVLILISNAILLWQSSIFGVISYSRPIVAEAVLPFVYSQ